MNYKRENQISDLELNSFRRIEINKLLSTVPQVHKSEYLTKRIISIFLMSTMILVLLGVMISSNGTIQIPINQNDPTVVIPAVEEEEDEEVDKDTDHEKNRDNDIDIKSNEDGTITEEFELGIVTVSKLSEVKYLVRYKDSLFDFELTYESLFVYRGKRESYNELFDMNNQYVYAPSNVQEAVDIEFAIFKLDEYRFFLDVSVNGVHRYMQFCVFPPHNGYSTSGINLDIINLEEDITTLYELIEAYPPIFVEERQGQQIYAVNPLVHEVEDKRAVDNYIKYVVTNYQDEFYYGTEFDQDSIYYKVSSIIIFDDENQLEEEQSLHIEMSNSKLLDYDVIINGFDFVPVGEDSISSKMWTSIDYGNGDIIGRFISFQHNDKPYKYLFLNETESNIDLSLVDSVRYEYELPSFMEGSDETIVIDLPVTFFEGFLVTEPLEFPLTELGFNAVHEMHITLYDAAGLIICEFDVRM